MSVGILGKKVGMTQVFDEAGKQVPVTVLKVESNYVVQVKSKANDGYCAVQLGNGTKKHINKPQSGHLKKHKVQKTASLREFRVTQDVDGIEPGDRIKLDTFEIGDHVNVTTCSIGKGFQGVVKRHGYAGGPKTHGSHSHRIPGSIASQAGGKGACKKVQRGTKLPGQMGNKRVTLKNLTIVDIDTENELLVLKGNVPGGGNNLVVITTSYKNKRSIEWQVEKPAEEEAPVAETQQDEEKQEEGVEAATQEIAPEVQPEEETTDQQEVKSEEANEAQEVPGGAAAEEKADSAKEPEAEATKNDDSHGEEEQETESDKDKKELE